MSKHPYNITRPQRQGISIAKQPGWLACAKRVYRRYKDGDLTLDNFIELAQKPCYYCGTPPSNKFNPYLKGDGTVRSDQRVTPQRVAETWWVYNGLDRQDNNLPHTKANCVPCCRVCNLMKRNMSSAEFKDQCRKVTSHE